HVVGRPVDLDAHGEPLSTHRTSATDARKPFPADVRRGNSMIPEGYPLKPGPYRKMFGADPGAEGLRGLPAAAPASGAALVRVPSRPPLDPHLRALLRQPRLHRRMS